MSGPATAALCVVTFVVTLEAACRAEEWVQYRTPLLSVYQSTDDLIERDRDGVHGRANARYQKWVMNNIGTRGPDVERTKPPSTLRLIASGASETFGLYEAPNQEFPRQLEDSLEREIRAPACAGSGIERVEVLNAAMAGMSLPTVEQDVRTRLARLGADVLLFYPSPTQYLEDARPVAARPDSNAQSAPPPWTRTLHLRMLGRLRDQGKRLLPQVVLTWMKQRYVASLAHTHAAGWKFESIPQDRINAYASDLRTLIGTTRRAGAIPIVATHASIFPPNGIRDRNAMQSWERFYPRATGDVIVSFDSAARLTTLAVAQDSGVAAIDLQPVLADSVSALFADHVHFTNRGAARVAGALARGVLDALRQSGSLHCGPVGTAR